MAGRVIEGKRTTVSAATATGYLTVTSSVGFYVGAYCWLSLTDNSAQTRVRITEIVSATVIGVRAVPDTIPAGSGPNYGRSNVVAYNGGGFLDQEGPQFIYNQNDAPAP